MTNRTTEKAGAEVAATAYLAIWAAIREARQRFDQQTSGDSGSPDEPIDQQAFDLVAAEENPAAWAEQQRDDIEADYDVEDDESEDETEDETEDERQERLRVVDAVEALAEAMSRALAEARQFDVTHDTVWTNVVLEHLGEHVGHQSPPAQAIIEAEARAWTAQVD